MTFVIVTKPRGGGQPTQMCTWVCGGCVCVCVCVNIGFTKYPETSFVRALAGTRQAVMHIILTGDSIFDGQKNNNFGVFYMILAPFGPF